MVHCGLRILNINQIDPVKFSFSVNVAYRFYWVDNRVQTKLMNKSIALDQDFISKIWRPKFSTIDLQEFSLLGLERDGLKVRKVDNNNTELRYTTDGMVVFKCPINYSLFPFHSATCKLRITSVSHKNESIIFKNTKWPPYRFLDSSIEIQGYDFTVNHLTGDDTVLMSWSRKGWYSVAGLQIDLISRHRKYIFGKIIIYRT